MRLLKINVYNTHAMDIFKIDFLNKIKFFLLDINIFLKLSYLCKLYKINLMLKHLERIKIYIFKGAS